MLDFIRSVFLDYCNIGIVLIRSLGYKDEQYTLPPKSSQSSRRDRCSINIKGGEMNVKK